MYFKSDQFAVRLKDFMTEAGLNAEAAGKEIGVSRSAIYRYLSGARVPETAILLRIADRFHCSVDYLAGVSDVDKEVKACGTPPFSEQFKKFLKSSGASKYALQKSTKLSESILYEWQKGVSVLDFESVLKVAEFFGCSADELFGR